MISATLDQLIDKVSEYLSQDEVETIRKAYDFASQMHNGQYRQKGEPYNLNLNSNKKRML